MKKIVKKYDGNGIKYVLRVMIRKWFQGKVLSAPENHSKKLLQLDDLDSTDMEL